MTLTVEIDKKNSQVEDRDNDEKENDMDDSVRKQWRSSYEVNYENDNKYNDNSDNDNNDDDNEDPLNSMATSIQGQRKLWS